jgi:hypothetical protein
VIWASAVEAAWKTIVLLVLGNVAISLVSGIFSEMAPSLPPGFAEAEGTHHARHHWHGSGWVDRSAFYPVFALMFAGIVWSRLRGPATAGAGRMSRRLQRIQKAFRENWFGLIVGNAFGAMIGVMVALWIQRFSFVQSPWHWVMQLIVPEIRGALEFVFGERMVLGIGSWWDWFGQNQPKFDFWMIYIAAICDDLGIPNIKTLGRWLWRKVTKSKRGDELKTTSEGVLQNEELSANSANSANRGGV